MRAAVRSPTRAHAGKLATAGALGRMRAEAPRGAPSALSSDNESDFAVKASLLVAEILGGPPRRILLVLGWDVGDDPEAMCTAAFTISAVLAVVTACIWVMCQLACCNSLMELLNR